MSGFFQNVSKRISDAVALIWSTLSASGGAALIGFIQAGAGAILRLVSEKLRERLTPEDFGADGTLLGDSAGIKAAINTAEAQWRAVKLAGRRYLWDGSFINNDKVRLFGAGKPRVNATKTALIGGTIIEGPLRLTGSYLDLRDFGVDLGTTGAGEDADGIKCTAAVYNNGEHLHTENLITLCKHKTSVVHSMLFEGYQKHTGGNLTGIYGTFGCVIKNRNVQITTIETDSNNETGLYLKSDTAWGQCGDVQIGSTVNRSADQFGIRVMSDSEVLRNVQIGKAHVSDSQRSICVQMLSTGIDVRNVQFGAIISERASVADFSVLSQKSGGAIFDIGFETLTATDTTGKVIEAQCEAGASVNHLHGGRVFASYPLGTSQAVMDEALSIGGGINSTEFGEVVVIEAYGVGSKIGAIDYQNVAVSSANILGMHRCKVTGPGSPDTGNLPQTLAGATATLLVPENTSGDHMSFVSVTIAADTTITIFQPEIAGIKFSAGHVLFVRNNSGFTLTIANNGAGGIVNIGYASIVLASNDTAAWIWGGAVWHQLK